MRGKIIMAKWQTRGEDVGIKNETVYDVAKPRGLLQSPSAADAFHILVSSHRSNPIS